MARVKYNPDEKDDNYVIEEAIMGELRAGETSDVIVEHIETCYEVVKKGNDDSDEDEIV